MKRQNPNPRHQASKKQNEKHFPSSLIPALSASILALSLTALTCGTFAWFAYAARATVEYNGITIGGRDIQIGYVSELQFTEYTQFDLAEEELVSEGKFIYWFTSDVTTEPLAMLIDLNGYAYDLLKPVTTGRYEEGTMFFLQNGPVGNNPITESTSALHKSYSYLPFVFRVESDTEPGIYLPNNTIYMSIADVTSVYEIKEAMRIHTDDQQGNTHLINPTAEEDGSDNVGGALDLDGDFYYDYYEDSEGKQKEILYGEFDGEHTYFDEPRDSDSEQIGEWDTFNSKHKAGVYEADIAASSPAQAHYECMHNFAHRFIPITRTNAETYNYAFANLSVYVEGWDTTVTDFEMEREFALGLQFDVLVE